MLFKIEDHRLLYRRNNPKPDSHIESHTISGQPFRNTFQIFSEFIYCQGVLIMIATPARRQHIL